MLNSLSKDVVNMCCRWSYGVVLWEIVTLGLFTLTLCSLPVSLSVCLSLCLSVCLSVCLYAAICLSLFLCSLLQQLYADTMLL